MCLSCRIASGPICSSCRQTLRPIAPTVIGSVPVHSAFEHATAASALVHLLKYQGSAPAAALLAAAMHSLLPATAHCLVPVPRSRVRMMRYGVDPARSLARHLSVRTGLPVVEALAHPLWHSRHAGQPRWRRTPQTFRAFLSVDRAVLVDDVFTTGATARSALAALSSAVGVVTATRSGGTSLLVPTVDE